MVLDDRFWDIYMQVYDLGVATLHPYQLLLDEVVGLLPENLHHSMVLETGCGTGNVLKCLLIERRVGSVIGLERLEAAIEIAMKKLAGQLATPQIAIYQTDLNEDWPSRLTLSADAVISVNVLYALADPAKYLRQVRGLLKPKGVLVISNACRPEPQAVFDAHAGWLAEAAKPDEIMADTQIIWARDVVRCMNQHIATQAKERRLHFLEPLELMRLLTTAGFRIDYVNSSAYAGVNVTVRAIAY